MGRDKFLYLLRKHHLILPPRKPKHTTNSNHIYFKYPNLIKGMPITYVNQVWVCDITYIYTAEGFCYLHLVTDAFSRMIIGFILAPTLEAQYTVQALEQAIAIAGGGNLCGTIHHSDRGIQYACDEYTTVLRNHHIRISMTEDSNPTDNGLAERVNGILKSEFIESIQRTLDIEAATDLVEQSIYTYNHIRPHRSLDMCTPADIYYRE